MMRCKSNHSCRGLFANLKILPLPSQYIFLLLLFLNKNRNQFKTNSDIHHYATRQQFNFYQPSDNLTKYQKEVYYHGVKMFNMLPPHTEIEFDNPKKYKSTLKKFLCEKSFYSLNEFFESQKITNDCK
jgi:hypothetical protein